MKKLLSNTSIYRLRKKIRSELRKVRYNQELTPNRLQGQKIVHLLHIGKTGGTAVRVALMPVLITDEYRIELHEHDFTLRDVPGGDKVIFFLRDPITRFVSGFCSRKRKGQPKYNTHWNDGERMAFKQFGTPNELAAALSSKDRRMRKCAIAAMNSIQHVNAHYWNWFESEAYFMFRFSDVLFIGFQENLDHDFTILKRKLNLPQEIQLPKDDINAHKNLYDLDTHLNEEAIKNLTEWYARDYEFIKLCNEKTIQFQLNT